jgi:capsule polysaccharide export protein KpsC/LpsZ
LQLSLTDLGPHVFTWSYRLLLSCKHSADKYEVTLKFEKDGLLRSERLDANRATPTSMAFDKIAMHPHDHHYHSSAADSSLAILAGAQEDDGEEMARRMQRLLYQR